MTTKEFFEKYPDYIDAMREGKRCRFGDVERPMLPIGFRISSEGTAYFSADDQRPYLKYEVIKQVPYLKSMTECMRWIEENEGIYDGDGNWSIAKSVLTCTSDGTERRGTTVFANDLWYDCSSPIRAIVWYPKDLIEWRDE